ncbi:hypothetical protein SDC9_194559 [bioreactor metagenome]|uniref:Uncharacterized protein n=1 Tax=bioreactor metagenome TaxID=1076179 RepID=A0A645I775_9ZZZZ
MCGCTGVVRPASWLRSRRRNQTDCAVRRAPRRPTNNAASSRADCAPPNGWARTSIQACTAVTAAAPMGTLRRLEPLPKTCASPACRSSQPRPSSCAAEVAITSSPTSSPTRRPQPYSSSTMAASRASSHGSALGCSCSASRTASSTPRALGNGLGALGARTPCTGL